MHLLVLSAFRRLNRGIARVLVHRVSMHLLVLSAFRRHEGSLACRFYPVSMHLLVLSAFRLVGTVSEDIWVRNVSMHLLVLSAFRHKAIRTAADDFSVSMHLLVLSAFRRLTPKLQLLPSPRSQCTFWCSVLSDGKVSIRAVYPRHGLNAPFGAQCFPTRERLPGTGYPVFCLNAPFGAQCFPTRSTYCSTVPSLLSQCTFWCSVLSDVSERVAEKLPLNVSMHLLVLSAFRPLGLPLHAGWSLRLNAPFGAQCFPTTRPGCGTSPPPESQCTFWCSVLSDIDTCGIEQSPASRLNAPFGAQCFPTNKWDPPLKQPNLVSMHLLVLSAFRRKVK